MPASSHPRLYDNPKLFNTQTLKPVLRAYGWAFLSVTAPRIISLLFCIVRGKKTTKHALEQIYETLKRQLGIDKAPASFAILVSGVVVVPQALAALAGLSPLRTSTRKPHWSPSRWHFLRFSCTFIAGLISFALLNRQKATRTNACLTSHGGADSSNIIPTHDAATAAVNKDIDVHAKRSVPLAGRTIDLTFFGMVRATDICLRTLWTYYIPPHKSSSRALDAARTVDRLAGPITFIASSSIIMWAWFYSPYNLPKAYQAWISNAAQLDERLLTALRECRAGNFVYGKETGAGEILKPMCQELGYPEEWGNPAQCRQIPCKLGHCGMGDNCEWHALRRLAQAWLFAFKMYLPLNMLIFTRRKPNLTTARKALRESGQSSAFLGAFVALFYYGVCLARRRVGPKLLPGVTPQQWDNGLSVSVGCLLCGTSIMLEKRSRRQEIAFFVAPRALATAFPRRYDRRYIWREQVAYASCAAVILTAAVDCPRQVRGVFGKLLGRIFA